MKEYISNHGKLKRNRMFFNTFLLVIMLLCYALLVITNFLITHSWNINIWFLVGIFVMVCYSILFEKNIVKIIINEELKSLVIEEKSLCNTNIKEIDISQLAPKYGQNTGFKKILRGVATVEMYIYASDLLKLIKKSINQAVFPTKIGQKLSICTKPALAPNRCYLRYTYLLFFCQILNFV